MSVADPADSIAAVFATLAELPGRLARFEAQQREILERIAALAPPAVMSLEDASQHLGASPATLRRRAAAGELPGAVRRGRRWFVDLNAARPPTPETIGQLAEAARAR